MKEIQKELKHYIAFYNSIYALLKREMFWITANSNHSLTGKLCYFEKRTFTHKTNKTTAAGD